MTRRALALLALILLLPAAAAAQEDADENPYAPGDHTLNLKHRGRRRTYMVYLPGGYSRKKRYPVIVILEGGRGGPALMREITLLSFEKLADKENIVLVYPEPIENLFNDGRKVATYKSHAMNVDDVGFISKVIRRVVHGYNGYRRRVYLAGFSNGGIMAQRAACEITGRIAAVASVAGALPKNVATLCAPLSPPSILIIHGDKDQFIRYNSNVVNFGPISVGEKLTIPRTVRFWINLNGCRKKPRVKLLPDKDPKDGTRVRRYRYGRCRDRNEVLLYRVEDGGHTWPGKGQWKPRLIVGRTTRDINATQEIWEFFKRHSLPKG